jgi:Tol biopolymer transport system component
MTRWAPGAIGLLLLLPLTPRAQEPAVLFREAVTAETVDGNLKGAIEKYRKVVASSDRALAAEALLRIAGCYERLGDTRAAATTYEQIIQAYADVPAAAKVARDRLGRSAATALARGDRAVWTGPAVDLFGRVSPDGRFISYVDWNETCNVMVHDLLTGTDRTMTGNTPTAGCAASGGYSVIAPDSRQLAYVWEDYVRNRNFIYVTSLLATGAERRELFADDENRTSAIRLFDWSPDGRSIVASFSRPDRSRQLALIDVVTGATAFLKSFDWSNAPSRVSFSKDGRYVAYDAAVSGQEQRDIFLLATDASRELRVVEHTADDHVMGWSPDGRHLLFASDRTGSWSLWGLPVDRGRAVGSPKLLRADIGSVYPLGLSASGSVYVFKKIASRDVHLASIDLHAGQLTSSPQSFSRGFLYEPGNPDWSPDGLWLAYRACGGNCLAVRSTATGTVRKVPSELSYLREPRWSPDGRKLVTAGNVQGRSGIYEVDVETGRTTPVVRGSGFTFSAAPQYSRDGTKIYYRDPRQDALIEHDLTSGTTRKLFGSPGGFRVSPNGQYLAHIAGRSVGPENAARQVLLLPVAGGPAVELLRLSSLESLGALGTWTWSPDSRSLIIATTSNDRTSLWQIPIDGSGRRKLEIDIEPWQAGSSGGVDRGFNISPDGRRIAFLMGRNAREVWVLENLLPATAVK